MIDRISVGAIEKDFNCRASVLYSYFGHSRSKFYRTRSMSYKDEFDYQDYLIIKKYFLKRKEKVGIRQLKLLIERHEGKVFNLKKIARIKKKYGLITQIRLKSKSYFSKKNFEEHRQVGNKLDRQFHQKSAGKVICTDITEFKANGRRYYLSAFKDLYTKEIVQHQVHTNMTIGTHNRGLNKLLDKMTIEQKKNLMIHSDQGIQYTHYSFQQILAHNGIEQSMSRKGNCHDNAPIESFFGYLKDHLDVSNCRNLDEVKRVVRKEINYYNNERPQLGLNKMPPAEYRRHA